MTDLVHFACHLAQELERRGVEYALGGALALGFHAPPRGTQDIELNLFVDPSGARAALAVLRDAGVEMDLDAAVDECRVRGDTRGVIDGVRVDIFVNSIPLHELAHRRRRRGRCGWRRWSTPTRR